MGKGQGRVVVSLRSKDGQALMYYVYILLCADETLYTGITTDLLRRTQEHNTGALGATYTATRRPVSPVYSKIYKNRSEASREEARIKKLTKRDKLKLIEGARL